MEVGASVPIDRPAVGAKLARALHQRVDVLVDRTSGQGAPAISRTADGMIACFGRSYAEAYGGACSTPILINL
jgi:hypothetical protein